MNEAPRTARSQQSQNGPERTIRSGHAGMSRLLRGALSLAGGAVALFHAALLAERLRDFSIAEPAVLTSWLGAAALGVLALYLRRRGLTLTSGRSGLVFWLLVLLLHLGFAPTTPGMVRAQQLLALPLEIAAISFTTFLATALVAALLFAVRARSVARIPVPTREVPERSRPLPALALGSLAALFVPRPPPAG